MRHLPRAEASRRAPMRTVQGSAQAGAPRNRLGIGSTPIPGRRGSPGSPPAGAGGHCGTGREAWRRWLIAPGYFWPQPWSSAWVISRGMSCADACGARGRPAPTRRVAGDCSKRAGRARRRYRDNQAEGRRRGVDPASRASRAGCFACRSQRAEAPRRSAACPHRTAGGSIRRRCATRASRPRADARSGAPGKGSACSRSLAGHVRPDRPLRARRLSCRCHLRAACSHQVLRRLLGVRTAVPERHRQRSRRLGPQADVSALTAASAAAIALRSHRGRRGSDECRCALRHRSVPIRRASAQALAGVRCRTTGSAHHRGRAE